MTSETAEAEAFLSSKASGTPFQEVRSLDLSEALKDMPQIVSSLNSFTALEQLNISHNGLETFPDELVLPHLKTLDISFNDIQDLTFLKSFHSLEKLNWAGNARLGEESQYVAIFYLKKLTSLNGEATSTHKQYLKKLRKALFEIVLEAHKLHGAEIQDKVHSAYPRVYPPNLVEDLLVLVRRRISDGKEEPHFPLLQEILIREHIRKLLDEVAQQERTEVEPFVSSEGTNITIKMKHMDPVPDYDPVAFLRCHSKDDRKSDKSTKIWRAAFRPGSHVVASCGGNYVCLIDADQGKVVAKHKLQEEDFYCVAWTHMQTKEAGTDGATAEGSSERAWLLATAGFRGAIRLLRPDQMTCVLEIKHHKAHVNCLLFHPAHPAQLFSGSADMTVCLWELDPVQLPTHRTSHRLLLKFAVPDEPGGQDVLNLHVRGAYLLAATMNDFVCWNCENVPDAAGLAKQKTTKQRKHEFQAELPFMQTDVNVMDGLVGLGNTPYVASKYYKDGVISIWDFDETIEAYTRAAGASEDNVDCHLVTRVKWSDCDELYINIGASADGRLLLAGDDAGNIWMYNLESLKIMGGKEVPLMRAGVEEDIFQPSTILEWPEVYADNPSDSGLDLDFDQKKIMMNYLAVSDDKKFIVGCTDVNIVCVWKVNQE